MNTQSMLEYLPYSFWFYVTELVRLRWLIFVTGFKRARLASKLVYLGLGILILAAIIGTYLLTSYVLGLMNTTEVRDSGINLDELVRSIPPMIISGAFLGILIISFGLLLQALYLANDMDFLLSSPIPIRAIFLTKLLQAILPNVLLIMTFALPVLFSLGISNGYNILYFALALVLLVFLSLAAAGVSSLLVMAVVHYLPAKRVAEILAFVAAIFFMALSQLGNLTGVSSGSLTTRQIIENTWAVANFSNTWSPLAWGGLSLVDLGEGRWLSGILFLVSTIGMAGGLFWLALNTAERLYYSGWASLQANVQPKKNNKWVKKISRKSTGTHLIRHWLPSQVWAILHKDFINLRRDLRNTSRMVMPLIMGIVFLVMMLRGDGKPSSGIENAPELITRLLQSAQAYKGLFIPVFVASLWILNLALIAFSIEGKSWWILRTSPVTAQKQLLAKFIVSYLPSLSICWLFLFVTALLKREPTPMVLYELFASALILSGLNGVMLSIGVRGANPYWDDPRHITTTKTDITGILVTIAYLLAAFLIFIAPPIGLPLIGLSEGKGQLVGLAIGGLLSVAFTIVPLELVKSRIYRIGEV